MARMSLVCPTHLQYAHSNQPFWCIWSVYKDQLTPPSPLFPTIQLSERTQISTNQYCLIMKSLTILPHILSLGYCITPNSISNQKSDNFYGVSGNSPPLDAYN
jgi:hypothetical protein